MTSILGQLSDLGIVLDKVTEKHKNNSLLSLDEIKSARRTLTLEISSLNKLYYQYFGGDKRLHTPLMNLISLINAGINFLDDEYAKVRENEVSKNDRGKLSEKMNEDKIVSVDGQNIQISPTYYEAYLQIFGSPRKALNAYARYVQLANLDDDGYSWFLHPTDKKEYQKAKRIHELAGEFVQSHRYMLEKDNYNQADVDYAFMQYNRESQDGASGDMLGPKSVTAGNAYITMILTKIFGGMRQHLKTYLDKNKENKEDKQNKEGLQKLQDEMEKDNRMKIWLDDEMYDSLSKNRDQMLMILRGLRNSMKTPTQPKVNQADLFEEFRNIMASFWFVRIFYQGKKDIDEYIKDRMELYFISIMDESKDYHKFQDMINELITQVLQEN